MFTTITLTEITCASCGCQFALQENFRKQLLENGKNFYCPAGHINYYPNRENELTTLKRQNENMRKRLAWAEESADRNRTALEETRRSKAAIKGQLTKTRNRIANGVCPCCHRTFKQLARHMENKHPDFKAVVS